jgi:glycosyltransferase involved in cell wall biosynthesis
VTEGRPETAGIFRDFVDVYRLPARDPMQPWPQLEALGPLSKGLDRARGSLRRRRHGRRLAYLDSTFPWERSGFRYHEALALHALRPDTLFFSMWELTDPFPAPVHPLSSFPRLALREGITDVYAVFSLFLESLVGMRSELDEPPHPMEGLDISGLAAAAGIRIHGTIFPGGGFTATPHGLEQARELAARLDTTISYVPEVLENVPGVTYVPQALTEPRFYEQTQERWQRPDRLVCLFAADPSKRKGLDVALEAFAGLDPDRFHLHLVGPHEDRREEFPAELMTFHGWLLPAQLRDLHRRVHVFLSPVSAEAPGPPGSYQGVTDGFPTQAAADAMSSGALLASANPAQDHRVLTPGEHYLELAPDPAAFRTALLELAGDLERTRRIAQAGSERVREQMDVRKGIATKLQVMGLLPDGASPAPFPAQ